MMEYMYWNHVQLTKSITTICMWHCYRDYSLLSQHHHLHVALLQRLQLTFMVLVSAAEKSSLLSPALLRTSSFFWTRGLKERRVVKDLTVTFTFFMLSIWQKIVLSWHTCLGYIYQTDNKYIIECVAPIYMWPSMLLSSKLRKWEPLLYWPVLWISLPYMVISYATNSSH